MGEGYICYYITYSAFTISFPAEAMMGSISSRFSLLPEFLPMLKGPGGPGGPGGRLGAVLGRVGGGCLLPLTVSQSLEAPAPATALKVLLKEGRGCISTSLGGGGRASLAGLAIILVK